MAEEHYATFDCANKCGKHGTRFIAATGHIQMMAAAQPFISGAISKTINLPNEADVAEIADCYRLSWELGLKANALYRDGSKLSQPLNTKSDADDAEDDDELNVEAGRDEVAREVAEVANVAAVGVGTHTVERIVEKVINKPLRRRLPDTRRAITHKFDVAGHEGYITVGLYDDGQPAEMFVTMSKAGSTIGGLMDTLATLVSVSLQYGVPVESLVRKFEHVRYEPSGMTRNRDIPMAKSLTDYIFRWMGMEFVDGYRAANAPKRATDKPAMPAQPAPPPAKPRANGNGHAQPTPAVESGALGVALDELPVAVESRLTATDRRLDAMSQQGANMQSDAPACDVCGSITVRSGTCYKCLNCGNSMGCS